MCLRCGMVDSGVSSFRSPVVKLEAAKAVEAMGRVSSSVDEVKTRGSFMQMSRRVCFFCFLRLPCMELLYFVWVLPCWA
ncbi:hypothetical protein Bca4012_090427 [Brassica carinata]